MDAEVLLGSFGIYDDEYRKNRISITDLELIDRIYPNMEFNQRSTILDKFITIMNSECGPHIGNPPMFLLDLAHKMSIKGYILKHVTTDLEDAISEYLDSQRLGHVI